MKLDGTPRPDNEFIYIGDPMCSWCWGFSPVLAGLGERFEIPLATVVGGLRPGESAEEVDDRLSEFLAHHWHQVEEASGQPFDHDILARRGWRYDTELPCRGVVTMREREPSQTRPFFDRLHRAFYVEGVDITTPKPYRELAADFVDDPDAFVEALASEEMTQRTWQDFALSRKLGVHGFPTLLLRTGEELAMVTRGWAPLEKLIPALEKFLVDRLGEEEAEGLFCEIGQPC